MSNREYHCDETTDKVERLSEALLDTIEEFSKHTKLTVGEAMGALFAVLIQSAKTSPQYNPVRLVEEITDRLREATGLQQEDIHI